MADSRMLQKVWAGLAQELFELRLPSGHWRGELAPSPLATATAISTLATFLRALATCHSNSEHRLAAPQRERLQQAILRGTRFLLSCQNRDGGWGDTDRSRSNIATAYLVLAALTLAKNPGPPTTEWSAAVSALESFIGRHNGLEGLRARYGSDKTFVAPIMTNLALAGLVNWRDVPPLPFELAAFPQRLYRFLRLPVVSYAIPALVTVGQVRFHFAPSGMPGWRMVRQAVREATLAVVRQMQPESGGFLEAVPLTAFVVMSLCGMGRAESPITTRGIEFLLQLQRPSGAWPVDSDLAVWTSTLAANALHASGVKDILRFVSLDWLLECQHRRRHPFTGAAPGGWAWTDQPGGVPDADDTSGALLAIAALWQEISPASRLLVFQAARQAIQWLLNLQNPDGGWPTFCRGWGRLPFDRSGVDLTAHAIRALLTWRKIVSARGGAIADRRPADGPAEAALPIGMESAIDKGIRFLRKQQREDGSWLPLWFGNEWAENEENPIYGTAKTILAFCDAGMKTDSCARRAVDWLRRRQRSDGEWHAFSEQPGTEEQWEIPPCAGVEETALALSALGEYWDGQDDPPEYPRGLAALAAAVRDGRHRTPAPIGLYFARLWYYERVYPIVFALEAIGKALQRRGVSPPPLDIRCLNDTPG